MFKRLTDGYFALGIIVGGFFAIFCLVWVIGLNYCPNQPCKYSDAADHPSDNGSQSIWNVPDAIRGTFSYNSEPEYAEGNPQRHEYYNLRAQERMAHATDWIAWLTAATGFFSILGLGAIIYTLNLQRLANQIMRDEQRPFLAPQGIRIEPQQDIQTTSVNKNKFVLHMDWANIGKSPAKPITIRAYCKFTGNLNDPDKLREGLLEKERHEIPARRGVLFETVTEPVWTLINGSDFDWPADPIKDKGRRLLTPLQGGAFDQFSRPTRPCVVMFEIDYISAFGGYTTKTSHSSRVCYSIVPKYHGDSGDFDGIEISPLHSLWNMT
ncbi:MAG: hypothetical protein ACU0CQ_11730 [Sulfitobacter sp.]|uniref:hypothetical protein n=1 Tax=Sulfitobacter sp. TaxID=1903071 RepID=UPI0040588456